MDGHRMGALELFDIEGFGPLLYEVDHIHFHSRSEHSFDNKFYDIEMHIVHKLVHHSECKQNLAVLGVLFKLVSEEEGEGREEENEFIRGMTVDSLETKKNLNLTNLFSEENFICY
jgi:carbonic anhydrase